MTITYTRRPPAGWDGYARRVDREMLAELAPPGARTYVCGPTVVRGVRGQRPRGARPPGGEHQDRALRRDWRLTMEHLDGNAAAGDLSEVFTLEATTATATCAGCGTTGPVAAGACVYETGMGTVLRCPECDAVLLRLVHARGEIRMEMRGVRMLHWQSAAG